MSETVIAEVMESMRFHETFFSSFIFLVDRFTHTPIADAPLDMDSFRERMMREVDEMRQRQERGLQYLRQLYETNAQCLLKITALKEDNERLKASQRELAKKLQGRVENALFVLEQQKTHYLDHFSHCVALDDFWRRFLPTQQEPSAFIDENQRVSHSFAKKMRSSSASDDTSSEDSSVDIAMGVERELVEHWERDSAKVLKYLSVYCVRRLHSFATANDKKEDENIAAEQFVHVLLSEIKNLGSKVDALRYSRRSLSSSSLEEEDSLRNLFVNNFAQRRATGSEVMLREQIASLQQELQALREDNKRSAAELRKKDESIAECKKLCENLQKELDDKNVTIRQLEDHLTVLRGSIARRDINNNSNSRVRESVNVEKLLCASPKYLERSRNRSYSVSSSLTSSHRSSRDSSSLSSRSSFVAPQPELTPIRPDHTTTPSALTRSSLVGEDLSLFLSSSNLHYSRFNSAPRHVLYENSLAVSEPDLSNPDITLEELARSSLHG